MPALRSQHDESGVKRKMRNTTELKKENLRNVISALRTREEITKPEIAKMTQLTTVTVNNLVAQLEQVNLIRKAGLSTSNGGRKAQVYTLNREYGYICGISLRVDRIVIGLFDFDMKMLLQKEHPWLLDQYAVEETIQRIYQFVLDVLDTCQVDIARLIGIGINVPGPVDFDRGKVISLRGYPRWRNIDLATKLQRLLNVTVLVDKDVFSGITLIRQMTHCEDAKNLVYFSVEGGIGCGVMIQGYTYRGNHGLAGEMGHITMLNNKERCSCGNVGCLELVASDFAIIQKSREALGLAADAPFMIADAIEQYRQKNPAVTDIFMEAIEYMAIAIRNSFMLYDPDEVFIRCKWLEVDETLFFRLVNDLYENNSLLEAEKVNLTLIHDEDFVLKSAAMIAWENELSSFDSKVYQ